MKRSISLYGNARTGRSGWESRQCSSSAAGSRPAPSSPTWCSSAPCTRPPRSIWTRFPAGQDPRERGVDPAFPITFDLTQDLPDNQITVGDQVVHLGNHVSNGSGGALISLFGDLKRHNLGGEAFASRTAFANLSAPNQADLIAFLNRLTLFKQKH